MREVTGTNPLQVQDVIRWIDKADGCETETA